MNAIGSSHLQSHSRTCAHTHSNIDSNTKTKMELGMTENTVNPSTGEAESGRQADLCECKASLVYLANSRPTRAHGKTLSKERNKQRTYMGNAGYELRRDFLFI